MKDEGSPRATKLQKDEPARPVPQPPRETALAIRAILPLTPPTIKLNFCHFLGA